MNLSGEGEDESVPGTSPGGGLDLVQLGQGHGFPGRAPVEGTYEISAADESEIAVGDASRAVDGLGIRRVDFGKEMASQGVDQLPGRSPVRGLEDGALLDEESGGGRRESDVENASGETRVVADFLPVISAVD
ncbi:MAG TPA: hypothetical protein VMN36_00575 [Verrucomicrobiales bacterium]|nr:hypothetical protein [Verrucomicrobiales bacterium]